MTKQRNNKHSSQQNGQPPLHKAETVNNPAKQLSEQQGHLETISYDTTLLERARMQWQFGDWQSLSELDPETLQHHPDRAQLILLAASGRLQAGDTLAAHNLIDRAKNWGCGTLHISQVLAAGAYNNLGRIALLKEDEHTAQQHFCTSVKLGAPNADVKLLTQARSQQQLKLLGKSINHASQAAPTLPRVPLLLNHTAKECINAPDPHDAIDAVAQSGRYHTKELFFFYVAIADEFIARKDKTTAVHFLQEAQDTGAANASNPLKALLIKQFLACGRPEKAADIAIPVLMQSPDALSLDAKEQKSLLNAYHNARKAQTAKSEHGHDLLLAYLAANPEHLKAKPSGQKPVLIEVGTTRENVPGQGSTRKIAEFCKHKAVHFITVDMDPHNTRMANNMFNNLGVEAQAITMKGEDYLRQYDGEIDLVFLDAYDFDHGKHSDLRQSRYQKYLGSSIDELACHQMHLECAQSVVKKLAVGGLVCVDDTWLDNGQWTAKGTLAVPYLLNNGFTLLEARNRAALLTRDTH
jgi:hypothetical protein